ncbi:ABC transporter substrate-binding protein [Klebsiella pneumoniae]
MNTRLTPVFTLLTVAALATSASCFAAEKFTFLTNWYAQAEHGGFYQAQATGLYQHAGLDVEIKMGAEQIAFGIAQMKQYQLVTGGDAKSGGIGIITEPRLKKTWDMLVKNKLIDASKVPFEQTYTLEMVKDAGVMP